MFGTGNVEVVSLAARFSVSTTRKSRVYKWVENLGCTSGLYKWVWSTSGFGEDEWRALVEELGIPGAEADVRND